MSKAVFFPSSLLKDEKGYPKRISFYHSHGVFNSISQFAYPVATLDLNCLNAVSSMSTFDFSLKSMGKLFIDTDIPQKMKFSLKVSTLSLTL